VSNNAKKTAPAGPSGPFDVKTVEALVELMTEHDLSEIELRDGIQRLRLRRGTNQTAVVVPASVPLTPAMPAAAPAKPAQGAADAATSSKKNLVEIKSETVGTYYAQPKPGEPPYVKLGDRVTPNKVVGLVEVMKTYNELQAGCSGIVVEILVQDAQPVEFGQVLFRVDPS
jgi:acetyl-CoA carboxylase biotin carboxyl carrier protein